MERLGFSKGFSIFCGFVERLLLALFDGTFGLKVFHYLLWLYGTNFFFFVLVHGKKDFSFMERLLFVLFDGTFWGGFEWFRYFFVALWDGFARFV